MSRRYKVRVNEKEVAVEVTRQQGLTLEFVANGENYAVEVSPVLEEFSNQRNIQVVAPLASPAASGLKRNASGAAPLGAVVAPMPGIIVSLAVKQGDAVKAGSTLCVIEAMKMENNISAPKDGIVSKVSAVPGKEVENGAVLFIIE